EPGRPLRRGRTAGSARRGLLQLREEGERGGGAGAEIARAAHADQLGERGREVGGVRAVAEDPHATGERGDDPEHRLAVVPGGDERAAAVDRDGPRLRADV